MFSVSFPNGSDDNIFRQVKVKSKPRTKMATATSAPSVDKGVYKSMCMYVHAHASVCISLLGNYVRYIVTSTAFAYSIIYIT